MINKVRVAVLLVIFVAASAGLSTAQKTEVESNNYTFTLTENLEATSVKDQGRTGTCWSFASLSFLESELMRMGKDSLNLSEMYFVRRTYEEKADKYVRMHGDIGYDQGGELHDVMVVAPEHGLVPESAYPGLKYKDEGTQHNHSELANVLTSFVDEIIQSHNGDLTPLWDKAYDDILDSYLGEVPESFTYKGNEYSPESFYEDYMGIDPDQYVEITSFKHKPFYEPYVIQLPDNWAWGEAYNLPLEDFTRILNNSLEQGYSVGWASDVSDQGFRHGKGLAIVPGKPWSEMSGEERSQAFMEPVEQRNITIEMRQEAYDSYDVTDDHAMHITGRAKDRNGTTYFLVKNSWGTGNPYNGYLYVSEAYIQLNSTAIMVNKDVIPEDIRSKMKGIDNFSW